MQLFRRVRGQTEIIIIIIKRNCLCKHHDQNDYNVTIDGIIVCGQLHLSEHWNWLKHNLYRVAQKNGTVDLLGLCSDQQLSFFTLLDRTSCPHYNNTKIIKFGWKLFILWVISYGLSHFRTLLWSTVIFFSPCWIEHLFLIIMTPRSSNLVENFLFYE